MTLKPIAAALALALGTAPAAWADWAPAPAGVATLANGPFYDARSRAYTVEVRARNASLEDLAGRWRVVVKGATLPVIGADGVTGQGYPYIDLAADPGYALDRGATSGIARVRFQMARRALSYELALEHDAAPFAVQLLHASDIDGKGPLEDVRAFSALLAAFRADLPTRTMTLSSGDNWIPGVDYNAAADPRMADLLGVAGVGRAHVAFLNAMGFEASAMGNHDLDGGPAAFAGLVAPQSTAGGSWPGASFPYLSANLSFATEPNTAPLLVAEGQPAGAIPGRLAGTATIEVDGRVIGIVGASTPKLNQITTVGGIGIRPADKDDLDALAAEIQTAVDGLRAMGVNKIVLLAHMQQLSVERGLATRLSGVDIIVGGGSNTRLLDANDILYPGDGPAADTYPLSYTSANGEPVLVVNTDGDFKYLGRLILDFDGAGRIDLASLDPAVNGAYAASAEGLVRMGLSESDANPQVVAIADRLQQIVDELAGNAFGQTSVFLRGDRPWVRTEETNLGNLTADSNLWYARQVDGDVRISLKNGGGIRAAIGGVAYPPGSTDPDDAILVPPAGGLVNQLDIQTALAFNNGLALVTVTAQELRDIVYHGIAASTAGSQQGRFPQISGLRFAFAPPVAGGAAAVLQSLAVVDESGAVIDRVVEGGNLVGDPARNFRMVTLNFLASGGDGYPFPSSTAPATARVDLIGEDSNGSGSLDPGEDLNGNGILDLSPVDWAGTASFAAAGSEQDAFAEYLQAHYSTVPFDEPETAAADDFRIQNLSARADNVFDLPPSNLGLTLAGTLDLPAAEISAYDPATRRLFVTNAATAGVQIVDLTDADAPSLVDTIDLSGYGATVTSVAVKGGVVAAAVVANPKTANGTLVLMDADGAILSQVQTGALPDMVTFDRAGDRILVANEGEPEGTTDPQGSMTLVDLSAGAANPVATQVGFSAFDGQEQNLRERGVRIFPGKSVSADLEPEYIALSPDDSMAYVSLQEANSIGVLDLSLSPPVVTEIVPLGRKDHSKLYNALDASDRDGPSNGPAIKIKPWPVLGMYMPDGIAAFSAGGETFLATANEGDARTEEARVSTLTLDASAFPNGATLKQNANLGRLTVSNIDGNTDADPAFEELHVLGARSFSLWRIDGDSAIQAFDSGDALERIGAQVAPTLFNANDGAASEVDTRSDNKGPEPEGVTLATIDGRQYAFVVLERAAGGVLMYDLTNPYRPRFLDYAPGVPDGQVSAESSVFIPAADHPGGQPLVVVSSEVSGSIAVYRVGAP